jgi:glutathione gamma-glutamylcysteinyltransferase
VASVSFHRKPLPEDLVAFDSDEGRQLLVEAVTGGTAASFFPLVAQLHTQADPAWCGLGSLVTTLNALGIDPQRTWKGPWRHFSEELLICCKALEEAAKEGLTLVEVGCLAHCNGAKVRGVVAEPHTLPVFRADLEESVRGTAGPFVVVNYTRTALGQTGSGHFSPLGAWHPGRDLVLVLDVARFKYPPHWVAVERLWQAMREVDPDTGHERGWLVLDRGEGEIRQVCG